MCDSISINKRSNSIDDNLLKPTKLTRQYINMDISNEFLLDNDSSLQNNNYKYIEDIDNNIIENKENKTINYNFKIAQIQLKLICRIFYYYFNKKLILRNTNEYILFRQFYVCTFKIDKEKPEDYCCLDENNKCTTNYDKLIEKNYDDFYLPDYPDQMLDEEIQFINNTCKSKLERKMLFIIQRLGRTNPSRNNYNYFSNIKCPKEEFNNIDELFNKVDESKLNGYYLDIYYNLLKIKDDIKNNL